MRNVPLLLRHYELNEQPPAYMATGFAGFLLYMKVTREENGRYFGERNGEEYEIKDDSAPLFYRAWQQYTPDELAQYILQQETLWGTDLTRLPGLLSAVQHQLNEIISNDVLQVITQLETQKITA